MLRRAVCGPALRRWCCAGAEGLALRWSGPAPPGSAVSVDATARPGAAVRVAACADRASATVRVAAAAAGAVTVEPAETESGTLRVAVAPGDGPLEVKLEVPERYVGVAVATRGGAVSVEAVAEAPVDVRTMGGALQIGAVRGGHCALHTGGGDLSARTLQAELRVATGGGALVAGKVVGANVEIDSGGGDVRIETLLVGRAVVRSAGGAVDVGGAHVDAALGVVTGGGAAHLGGVEGNGNGDTTTVETQGGAASVLLHERVGSLGVSTAGGRIDAFLPQEFGRTVRIRGVVDGAPLDGPLPGTGEAAPAPRGMRVAGPPPGLGGAADPAAAAVAATRYGDITLDTGGTAAPVAVRRRSWLDGVLSSSSTRHPGGNGRGAAPS